MDEDGKYVFEIRDFLNDKYNYEADISAIDKYYFGYICYFNSKKFHETGLPQYKWVGHGILIVDTEKGEKISTSSRVDPIDSIKKYIKYRDLNPNSFKFLYRNSLFFLKRLMRRDCSMYFKCERIYTVQPVGVTTPQSGPSTECDTDSASNHEQNPAGIPPPPSEPSSRDPQKP